MYLSQNGYGCDTVRGRQVVRSCVCLVAWASEGPEQYGGFGGATACFGTTTARIGGAANTCSGGLEQCSDFGGAEATSEEPQAAM